MKSRHAAALALVGWYLMSPPYADLRPKAKIPFAEWDNQHAFDSALDCDQVLSRWRAIAAKAEKETREFRAVAKRDPKTGLFEAPPGYKSDPAIDKLTVGQIYAYGSAECIASDDPRFKQN